MISSSPVCRSQTEALVTKNFRSNLNSLVSADRLIYGDYAVPGADVRTYSQLTDMAQLVRVCGIELPDAAHTPQPSCCLTLLCLLEMVLTKHSVLQPCGMHRTH